MKKSNTYLLALYVFLQLLALISLVVILARYLTTKPYLLMIWSILNLAANFLDRRYSLSRQIWQNLSQKKIQLAFALICLGMSIAAVFLFFQASDPFDQVKFALCFLISFVFSGLLFWGLAYIDKKKD